MVWRRIVAGLLVVAGAGIARASEVRTAAFGGIEGAVADEATDFNLFNAGNAAGLVLLERGNRLDYALGRNASLTRRVDNDGITTVTATDSAGFLGSPGGMYEGLQFWFSDADALSVSAAFSSVREVYSLFPEPPPQPAPGPPLDTLLPAVPSGDQQVDVGDGRITVGYAHRFGETLALGIGLAPVKGTLTPKKQDKVKTDKTEISLFDYQLGLAARLPLGSGTLQLGLNARPYDDLPDLEQLAGSPAELSSLGTPAAFGGLKVKRTFATDSGASQVTELTPDGRRIGLQAAWGGEGPWSARVGVDLTSASVKERVDTDTSSLPAPLNTLTKVDEGDASKYSRFAWDLGLRYRWMFGEDRSVRLGAALAGAPDTTDQLDFPNSTAITKTTTTAPMTASFGVAYGTGGGLMLGLGYALRGDTQKETDPRNASATPVITKPAGTRLMLGVEDWFTRQWAGRIGLTLASDQVDDNDPSTPAPGTSEKNPTTKATLISLGGGYRGTMFSVDALLSFGSPVQQPTPTAPATLTMNVSTFALAGKYSF